MRHRTYGGVRGSARKGSLYSIKNYYLKQIWIYHQRDFRGVSYCQFIKLINSYLPLLVLMLNSIMDKCDGISFIDSSSLEVCKRYRISMHRVFAGIAVRSKTTKG